MLVASGLQMSIPFLSFALVQGGVGSFVHLASSLQSASSSAAGTASHEATSGNRNFDNINKDTANIGNKSGFKTDFNQMYQEGATQIQGADGSVMKTFADGTSSIASGTGINTSSGTRAVFMEEGVNTSLQEGLTNSLSSLKSDEQHYQESQSSAINKATDRVAHLAQKLAAGESVNIDTTTEEGKAMQQAVNHTKSLHDRDGYGWSQAARAGVNAYIDGGGKIPEVMPFVKGEAGVRVDGGVSAENSSSQGLEKGNLVNRENSSSKSLNTLLRAASNEHYTKDDSIDRSLAQSTRASYDKMQSYGKSISQRREEAENYSAALHASQSRGATDRRDMYHDLEQKVAKQYGVSQEAAHKMIESNDPRANKVWNAMVESEVAQELAQVRTGRNKIADSASNEAAAFHNEHAGKINDQAQKDLQQQAAREGLNPNLMCTSLHLI